MNNDKQKYLTSTAAADYLGVSNSTLYRMITRGILEPIKTPGGQRRFEIGILDDYLTRSKDIVAPQNPSMSYLSIKSDNESIRENNHKQENKSSFDPRNKLNDLTGAEWLQETKSFFFQKGLGAKHPQARIENMHPATFSYQDIMRLVLFFTKKGQKILDPFGGVGSTAKACAIANRQCTQIELSEQWHKLAIKRLDEEVFDGASNMHMFIKGDCREELPKFEDSSFDFIVTSPPYWAILNKKTDYKAKERLNQNLAITYSDDIRDMGNIENYDEFLNKIVCDVFAVCVRKLKLNKYMCLIVSDFRNKSEFISFHSDLINMLSNYCLDTKHRIKLQGVKILAQNHKSLLPYGYPFAYVENIHHQYILVFRKELIVNK